jgi:hypothetical protein
VRLARAVIALAVAGVLTGCGVGTTPAPTRSESLAAQCADAANGIVDAVKDLVASYEVPGTGQATPTPTPAAVPTPSPSATSGPETGDPLAAAVAKARATRDRLGCSDKDFTADLKAGLKAIDPKGPIAAAVAVRATASLLGTLRQGTEDWTLEAGADLHDAVGRAAAGTTIILPAGTTNVDGTLVLLSGVTLRGAGRDSTTIRITAADAAVIVATAALVQLEDLTIQVAGSQPASGVVAGSAASLALAGVRVTGAKAGGVGSGGAGVYVSAQGTQGSGRGTTLEITDSVFEHNGWAGVAVAGGHRVSIESATFTDNAQVGILFLDSSSGSVSSSSFVRNRIGMAASGSSTPTLLSSTITGGSVGVQVDGSAAPVIEKLSISDSSAAAMIVGGSAMGSIGHTACRNVPYGIVISAAAAPTLVGNTCPVAKGG